MNQDRVIPLAAIDSLSKEVECIICLSTVNNSHMCIHCSAIVCGKCIENWINKTQSCPKCFYSVQQTDFVKCRLANKVVDFIEALKSNSDCNHSQETPKVYCSTCEKYVCFECILVDGHHINHDYKYIDEDYKQIIKLNHKLLDFIRKRYEENQDNLNVLESTIQTLLNNHSENMRQIKTNQQTALTLIKDTQNLFDDYQKKKQVYNDAIKADELIIKDIERRLNESKSLSDQEEILQLLQKNIPSKFQLKQTTA